MIEVKRWYLNNPLRNYNYALVNTTNKHALIVDPTLKQHYIAYISQHNLEVEAILLTHKHTDHIAAVAALQKHFNCPVYARFSDGPGFVVDHIVTDKQELVFNTANCCVIASPGHTAQHVCYFFENQKLLFCGDTIFTAGVGNVNAASADVDVLCDTVMKLRALPEKTRIYPAHDYFENNLRFALSIDPENTMYQKWYEAVKDIPSEDKPITTIADEKQMNIFMQADIPCLHTLLADRGKYFDDAKAVFRYLRAQKDVF
ncbi:hydroxyacylglutathione hydrolase [Facilibium subflavum]|uniref:hydroxyacylglutathione hydrolase n=1 Tax=Facilibium subflavum TaxID=2219058 RepID=UPI000E65C49F|nr:hydroxyacylglutathione hydrolase [Facilibium subflavum]